MARINPLFSVDPNINTFLNTPTSANLLTAVTDETGTGNLLFSYSPTINPATTSSIGLTIKGLVSQTANLQEWQDSSSNVLMTVRPNPGNWANDLANFNGPIQIAPTAGGTGYALFVRTASSLSNGITIRASASSQTGDLLQYQNSSSTVLGGRNASGQIYTGMTSPIASATIALSAATASSVNTATYTTAVANTTNLFSVGQIVTITGFTAETYFNGTFTITAIGGSSGAWTFTVTNANANFVVSSATVIGSASVPAQVSIIPISPLAGGLRIKGVANQYSMLFDVLASDGSTKFYVNQYGNTLANGGFQVGGYLGNSPLNAGIVVGSFGTGNKGIIVKATANTVTDLMQFMDSSNNVIAATSPIGQFFTGGTWIQGNTSVAIGTQTPTGTTNITITTGATHYISVGQKVTIAGVTPSGYNGTWTAQAGTTGTTLVVNIGSNPGIITVAGTVTQSAQLSVTSPNLNNTPVVIKAAASQAANMLEVQNSSGSNLMRIQYNGSISTGGNLAVGNNGITNGNQFQVTATSATQVGAVVKAAASQSANLFEIQDSSGTKINWVDQYGRQRIGTTNSGAFTLNLVPFSNTDVGILVKGLSGQTGSLQEWQDSSGTVLTSVTSAGNLNTGQIRSGTTSGLAQITGIIGSASTIGAIIRGASSQTANLQEWQDSSSAILAYVSSAGSGYFGGNVSAGIVGGLGARLNVQPGGASVVGTIVRGATSQTADLQQWQMWDGTTATTKAYVTADGSILTSATLTGSGNLRVGGLSSTGGGLGVIGISNATTVPASSPTGGGILYVDTGALKYLGTSGSAQNLVSADGTINFNGDVNASGYLKSNNSSGDEGGEIFLSKSVTNTTLNTGVTIDVYQNKLRFFEQGGTARGYYIDITTGGAGVGTNLVGGGSSFTGGTLTSNLTLAAGTTSLSPLTFQSGTNLTTVTAGANEYDGTVFYQTSNTSPGRALKTQNYYYASSSDWLPDFTASGAAKSMLGGATTGITVAAGTTYEFEFYTTVQHQYITNTGVTGTYTITSTTVSGSPTVAFIQNIDYGSNTTNFTTATTLSRVKTTGSVIFSAAISSGSRYNFLQAKGIIRITGTGTVKIYPSLATSQVGASDNIWTVQSGTVFKLTPIGNGTVTTVGAFA